MKKVALITFCNNFDKTNYGQVLQCYALYKKLNNLNLKVKVIPYREKDSKDKIKRKFTIGWLNRLYENWFQQNVIDLGFNKRVKKFQKFINKNVDLAFPCYNLKDVEKATNKCDILVAGSDQIWNPKWINKFYMLDFGNEYQRRISYASSGIIKENSKLVNRYKELGKCLNNFNYISVREKSATEILKKYTTKEIENVLDPTFLLNSREWDEIATSRIIKEPYILCYNLSVVRPYKMMLRKLKDYYKAERIVYIKSNLTGEEFPGDFIEINDAGPKEFLSLIKYSNAVCTDSFHGMALSINYNKQFCLLKRMNGESYNYSDRTTNILEKLDINAPICTSLKDIENIGAINYSKVNELLEKEREKSLDFLKKATSEE